MTIRELKEILSKIEKEHGDETVYIFNPHTHIYSQVERVYFDEWDRSLTIKTK